MNENIPEEELSKILMTRMIPTGTTAQTITYMRHEIATCGCEDLCTSCAVMYRWLKKMDPRWGTFTLLPGGRE